MTFHFTARPGVCGDGETFIRTGRNSYYGSLSDHHTMEPCIEGPVQVRLTFMDGDVVGLRTWVGPLRDRHARDLGAFPAPEAARYLLAVARSGATSASAKAIMAAVLADSSVVWPTLIEIARDPRSKAARQETMLWLSRFAAAAVGGHPSDPFEDEDAAPDDDLKSHAVFVLSQLPNGEGIADLLRVARSNVSPRVRGQAFFWLGQSGDPRAIDLFESVLRP